MSKLNTLRADRQKVLDHVALIEEMRRGSVTRQFLKIRVKGKAKPVLTGPYALYTCKKKGRTVGRRLHDPEEVRRLEQQVDNFHTFQQLCTQLVDISEQICDEKEKEPRR